MLFGGANVPMIPKPWKSLLPLKKLVKLVAPKLFPLMVAGWTLRVNLNEGDFVVVGIPTDPQAKHDPQNSSPKWQGDHLTMKCDAVKNSHDNHS